MVKDPVKVKAVVYVENGCNFDDGEYYLYISTDYINYNWLELVKECIDNDLKNVMGEIPIDRNIEVTLVEDGEWEDVFYNRYFTIDMVCLVDPVYVNVEGE